MMRRSQVLRQSLPGSRHGFTRRAPLLGGGAVGALAVGGSFLRMGNAGDYDRAMAALRAPLGNGSSWTDIVRYATLAANSHNSQAWRFGISGQSITISPLP